MNLNNLYQNFFFVAASILCKTTLILNLPLHYFSNLVRLHYQDHIASNTSALNIYLVVQIQILSWIQQQGVQPDW